MGKTSQYKLPTLECLNRVQLVRLKSRAIRAGVWFKVLTRIDRVLVDLTVKVAQRVRSPSLARSILTVTRKLEDLLEGKLVRVMREFGFPLAAKLGVFAQKWGNKDAGYWKSDLGFAQYLSVMKLDS